MFINNWLRDLNNDVLPRIRRRRRPSRPRGASRGYCPRALVVEPLEDRSLLTALLVNTLADNPSAVAGDDMDGLVSLREAVTAANTNLPFGNAPAGEGDGTVDSITFDAAALNGQTIVLGGTQLVITDHLSITGLGQNNLAISGNNASRVFSIDAGVSVDISDVTIADGLASDGGGIYNKGTLTVANGTLTGNNADDHQGGGIWSDGLLDITNSTLTGNYSYWEGGGIYNKGTLTITNSTLTGNSSDDQGGGIWSHGLLDITNSTLAGNESVWYQGGGIWSDGTLNITDGTFSENSSYDDGGGIWNGGTLNITNGTFSSNSAGLHGGGIHNLGGTVAITGSEFSGNSAYSTGGGFSSFIHMGGIHGTLDITGSTFSGNSAGSGGAIWNDTPANIADSTFSGNSARSFGGAISHRVFTMTITNSTLADNSSDAYGGALDTWGSTVILRDSTISGNSAKWDGGAIENYFATVELFNSTISGNSAGGLGGAIDNWGGTVESTNSTIVMNRADADGNGSGTGGGIYNYNASSVTLLNNTLLAGNLLGAAGSDSPNDLAGVNIDPASSHNLIGDANSSGGLTDGDNGNIVGNSGVGTIDITTVLDTNLADNGGPTLTHALVPGGLAVDAGDNSKAVDADGNPLDYDQRGESFARIGNGTVDIGEFEVQSQAQLVQIDVKPGSDPNAINLASNGLIAVAIFTTDDFDASLVDATTVEFAGALAVHSALEDVDGDGDLDMVFHFQVEDTDLAYIYAQLLAEDADSSHQQLAVSLAGKTSDNTAFEGTDGVDMFFSGKALRELLDELALAGVL